MNNEEKNKKNMLRVLESVNCSSNLIEYITSLYKGGHIIIQGDKSNNPNLTLVMINDTDETKITFKKGFILVREYKGKKLSGMSQIVTRPKFDKYGITCITSKKLLNHFYDTRERVCHTRIFDNLKEGEFSNISPKALDNKLQGLLSSSKECDEISSTPMSMSELVNYIQSINTEYTSQRNLKLKK